MFLKRLLEFLEDKQADDVNVIDVGGQSDLVEHFVIASGKSSAHLRSLSENLRHLAQEEFQTQPFWQEDQSASWIVMDFGSIMLHLFEPSRRSFYDLEGLWDPSLKKKDSTDGTLKKI